MVQQQGSVQGNEDSLIEPCVDAFMQDHPLWTDQNRQRYLGVLYAFQVHYGNGMPRDSRLVIEWLRHLPPSASKAKDKLAVTTRRDYFKRLRTFWSWARENWPPFSDLPPFPQPYEKFGKRKGNGRGK